MAVQDQNTNDRQLFDTVSLLKIADPTAELEKNYVRTPHLLQ